MLRHAPTEGLPGRFAGWSDRSIAPVGRDVAAALVEAIGPIDVAVITPLRRTAQTLELLEDAGLRVPQVLVEPGLVEQHFGDWEEREYQRLADADPAYWPFWADPVRGRPPGGESFFELFQRSVRAWRLLASRLGGAAVLHVGHAGPIRALGAFVSGGGARDALSLKVPPLSLRRLPDGGTEKSAPVPTLGSDEDGTLAPGRT